ncbi:MAG: hypothetical protein U0168_07440 [Nannocystaceae bacterium]
MTRSNLLVAALPLLISCNGRDGAHADDTANGTAATVGTGTTDGADVSASAEGPSSSADDASSGADGSSGDTEETGDPVIPEGHPRIYLDADNRARLQAALDAGAPAAIRFRDMVDGQLGGADWYDFQSSDAALLGALTGEPQYCSYAVDRVDAWVASEEALVASGQAAEVAGDSYLYVGDHVGDLALVLDWCWDDVDADRRGRWIAYANQAVYNVWHPEDASWGGTVFPWSGWSIDNPSNNYYYSFLRATMLLGLAAYGSHDDAQTWIDTFRVAKIENQLVPTFTAQLQGGGSREGTGYGVAMWRLFALYDLWQSSTGERIWDLTPHTRDSLINFVHTTVPTLDRIAPIGDHARDSTAALFDYHRAYLLVLQRLVGPEDPLSPVVQQFLASCSVPEMTQGFMYGIDFMYADPSLPTAPLASLHDTWYAPGTGSVFARTGWTSDAMWLGFMAGPYTESHAHRDQGQLLIHRGQWLAYDANIDSHSGIVQSESVHNLVRIDDGGTTVTMVAEQQPAVLVGLRDTPDILYLAADITPVYGGSAAVERSERELVFLEAEHTVVVLDRVDTAAGAVPVWQLNSPLLPQLDGDRVGLGGELDAHAVLPAAATFTAVAWPAIDPDLQGGHRVDLGGAPGDNRFVVVLAPPGRIAQLDAIDDADEVGVVIAFEDGGAAELRFARDTTGGSLTYAAAGGAAGFRGALSPGIDALPVFAR